MAGQGAQVGSAHISIFPVMTGFKSAVNKEVKSAGSSASSSFSSSFRSTGKTAGKKLGSDFGSAFKAASSDLGMSAVGQLEKAVSQATQKLSKARMKQADDADRVRVAEMRLKDAVEKYGESSTQAVAAEARLSSARRKLQVSTANAAGAEAELRAAQQSLKGVQDALASSADETGNSISNMAKRFAEGFRSAKVAESSFSGVEGALGGLARSISGIDIWGPFAAKVKGEGAKVASSISGVIRTALDRAKATARSGASAVSSAVASGLSKAGSAVSGAMSKVASAIPQPLKSAASKAGVYLNPIANSAKTVFSKVTSSAASGMKSLVSKVKNGASQASSILSDIGKAISTVAFTGAAAGIGIVAGKIAALAPEAIAASDATDKFKSTLNFAGVSTSEIDALTKSTQEYADRTVYELSDIQGITAQLASNGVAGYDKLAEAAGNLNAVAGGNADTFKSVGMVLTQTAGMGKLTTENFNQLAEAVPGASGKLQEALKKNGAYTGNFREAMEQGQISAEEFNQAIMDLGMTDVAKEAATSVSTFEGAMGNLKAAFVGGISKVIAPLKPLITSAIAGVAEWVTPVFDALAGAAEKVAGVIEGVVSGFSGIGEGLGGLSSLLAPIGAIAAAMGAGGLGGALAGMVDSLGPLRGLLTPIIGESSALSGVFAAMSGPVGIAVAAFAALAATSPEIQAALGDLVSAVLTPLQQIVGALIPPLQTVVTTILPVLSAMISAITPVIASVVQLVGGFVGSVMSALVPAFQTIGTTIQTVMAIASPLIQQFANMFISLMPQVNALIQQLAPIFQALGSAIGSVVTQAVQFISGTFVPLFQNMAPTVSSYINTVKNVIQSIVKVISGVVSIISGIMSGDWSQVWEGFKSVVSGAVEGLGSIVSGIKDTVMNALSGIGSWLVDSGKALLDGFIDGIKSGFESAANAIGDGVEWLRGFFPFSPAKRGAFSGHGYTTYSGRALMEDFGDSIASRQAYVAGAARKALAAVQGEFGFAVDGSGGELGRSGVGRAGGVNVTQIFNQPVQTPDEFARTMRMQERYGIAAVQ